jgi:hypothetical protein
VKLTFTVLLIAACICFSTPASADEAIVDFATSSAISLRNNHSSADFVDFSSAALFANSFDDDWESSHRFIGCVACEREQLSYATVLHTDGLDLTSQTRNSTLSANFPVGRTTSFVGGAQGDRLSVELLGRSYDSFRHQELYRYGRGIFNNSGTEFPLRGYSDLRRARERHEGSAGVTPEPSAIILFSSGLLGIFMILRKKNVA